MNSVIAACPSCGKNNRIPATKQHLHPRCGHCRAPIGLTDQAVPVELGDQDFHEFIKQAPLPVLVDFFSPTCGPCRTMLPIVDTLARTHLNRCIIAKVDTSRNQQLPRFFNIRAVPHFMLFKGGSLVDQVSGAVDQRVLEQKMQALCA